MDELTHTISQTCFWLADNVELWKPYALLFFVGLLIVAVSVIVEFWGAQHD